MTIINDPIVSVIIATYNRAKSLGRAIESVLKQSYCNIEIVVVDDGSTDETEKIIQPYIKKYAVRYIYQKNKGCVEARNNGIKIAKGKYIAILDDDDFWCNEKKLEKQVDFLEKNRDYCLVGGGAIETDWQGKEVIRYLLVEKDEDIRKVILVNNVFAHITVMFRKDVWDKSGGYDQDFDGMEDWDLWLKLGTLGKFYNIREFFASYIGHDSRNPGHIDKKYNKIGLLKLNMKLRKKYRHDYPGYMRAALLCWVSFLYSFVSLKQKSHLLVLKFKKIIFGRSPYNFLNK